MASGQLNSRELTHGYIRRIQSLNPLLHSVIELNPNAIAIATQLDAERRRGSSPRSASWNSAISEGQHRD